MFIPNMMLGVDTDYVESSQPFSVDTRLLKLRLINLMNVRQLVSVVFDSRVNVLLVSIVFDAKVSVFLHSIFLL